MNEPSIWTVIRFNKLINTAHAHTLVWIYLSVRRPLFLSLDLIFFHPIQGHYSDAQVFSVAAPATSWCTQLFYFYTGNQSVTCSTCISLNIQLLDMLHQPNTHHATHWNSICCWKWCTATHSSSRLQWSCCKQEQRWYFEKNKTKTFHQSKLNELKQSSRVGFQYDARVCSSAHACVVETSIQRVIVWVPVFVLFVWASWCICGCDCVFVAVAGLSV